MSGSFLASVLAFSAQGCAGDDGDSTDNGIEGYWEFVLTAGDEQESETVEIVQTGNQVEATQCNVQPASEPGASPTFQCEEAWANGTFTDGVLALNHTFMDEGDPATYEFSLTATLVDGRFVGQGSSTKCSCEFTVEASRHTSTESALGLAAEH